MAGDALIFQYLNNVSLDDDKVQVYTPMAQEIRACVRACDPNEQLSGLRASPASAAAEWIAE